MGNSDHAALVSDQDFKRVSELPWTLNPGGYAVCVWRNGKPCHVLMHRFIMKMKTSDKRVIDHRNRNRLDNRRSNLRVISRSQSAQNQGSRNGTSQYRGVRWHTIAGRWIAEVKWQGKQHYLGLFDDEEEAAQAASDFRRRHMPFAVERKPKS